MADVLTEAHELCKNNRDSLGIKCGCFYCLNIYNSLDINKWIYNGRTALCPKCGIDAVLAYEEDVDFLMRMHDRWFENK